MAVIFPFASSCTIWRRRYDPGGASRESLASKPCSETISYAASLRLRSITPSTPVTKRFWESKIAVMKMRRSLLRSPAFSKGSLFASK